MMSAPVPKRLTPMQDLYSGALSGCVSRMIVAPMDVLKIRLQVQQQQKVYSGPRQAFSQIVREEGVRSLWKGNTAALMLVAPFVAVQFTVYDQFKLLVQAGEAEHALTPAMALSGGALAGIMATAVTYPLDLLRTRLAVQGEPKVYKNMRSAVQIIYTREGIRGLYSGLTATSIEIIPYVSIQMASYETLKQFILGGNSEGQSNVQGKQFVCGALAGFNSKLLTYPLDTVKKRLQVQGLRDVANSLDSQNHLKGTDRYEGIVDCCRKLLRNEGPRGFYKGLTASLGKSVPGAAITFMTYETLKKFIVNSDVR